MSGAAVYVPETSWAWTPAAAAAAARAAPASGSRPQRGAQTTSAGSPAAAGGEREGSARPVGGKKGVDVAAGGQWGGKRGAAPRTWNDWWRGKELSMRGGAPLLRGGCAADALLAAPDDVSMGQTRGGVETLEWPWPDAGLGKGLGALLRSAGLGAAGLALPPSLLPTEERVRKSATTEVATALAAPTTGTLDAGTGRGAAAASATGILPLIADTRPGDLDCGRSRDRLDLDRAWTGWCTVRLGAARSDGWRNHSCCRSCRGGEGLGAVGVSACARPRRPPYLE